MAKKNTQTYTNESITSLKGADRVRKKPSVIFGSDGLEGCQHSVFEIISNSIDEARQGFGKLIEVTRHRDCVITVTDCGRGIPVDYNAVEQCFNWELIFCELYAGGKYDNNSGEVYQFSLGLNGLGLCSTQYASEWMDVEIIRDGYIYTLRFERGENVGGFQKTEYKGRKTGSRITWKPDKEVFTDICVPLSYFQEILRKQSIVNAGVRFVLTDEESGGKYEYYYEKGINDYIRELTEKTQLTPPVYFAHETAGRDAEDRPEYKLKFEVIFCFDNTVNVVEHYHNSSFLEYGGAPDKAVRAAFVAAIDGFIKNGGLYKKDEKKITYNDVEDSLTLISNSFSTLPSFENQTKKFLTNKFVQEAMTEYLKKQLEVYLIENKSDAERIIAQVLVNKRSRESAEQMRISVKKKLTGSLDISNRVENFVNCRTKDLARREIYIVEGKSALGACVQGRDAEFQAIMPVRGKILNCLKADYAKILQNEIVTDLVKVLGCGIEIRGKAGKPMKGKEYSNSFDIGKLNWNKVIICTDADYDGFHIRTLILTMFYRLMPSLIEERRIYIAESPLYEITCGKKTVFAYTDKEKDQIVSKLTGKVTIQRSKGLGENEPEMMWQTTMNPESRRLVQVLPGEAAAVAAMFEMFMGEGLKERKGYIEENGYRYIDMTEVV
jgi:DNA gyrase subunit B